ncbi:MAG TPA: toll/interleukin-1 receptor domain-containing protein [Candidatus Saccharimonadales bacterium]|nr:toll/interleukin-1 receptor domain-containing protein [Candidatus Saccharimonadales bacterium]
MLYDVFICHASADKAAFVRPLVEALRAENVEVWYDESSVKLGDSIRRAVEQGLKKSRFGIVVLSNEFFARNWPQSELDVLTDREMTGNDKVLLPIWHGITRQDVMQYSPLLAGRKAVSSSDGVSKVVKGILSVIHPNDSPLIVARDELLKWGEEPPVITDRYWLDVAEASNRIPAYGSNVPAASAWGRWSFPLPEKEGDSRNWGERLAWTALQLKWATAADTIPITLITPPDKVLQFIDFHAGLFAACSWYPGLLSEYAPQLTIPSFGGELEPRIEEAFRKAEPGKWIFRREDFAEHAVKAARTYFHAQMFGPIVSPYEDADHVFWLLSSASLWLPPRVRATLLKGLKGWHTWLWGGGHQGTLSEALYAAKGSQRFKWTRAIKDDVRRRIGKTVTLLRLPDPEDQLFECFKKEEFPELYLKLEKERLEERRSKQTLEK